MVKLYLGWGKGIESTPSPLTPSSRALHPRKTPLAGTVDKKEMLEDKEEKLEAKVAGQRGDKEVGEAGRG